MTMWFFSHFILYSTLCIFLYSSLSIFKCLNTESKCPSIVQYWATIRRWNFLFILWKKEILLSSFSEMNIQCEKKKVNESKTLHVSCSMSHHGAIVESKRNDLKYILHAHSLYFSVLFYHTISSSESSLFSTILNSLQFQFRETHRGESSA